MFHTKKYYHKKINDFLENLKRPIFEKEYLEHHKHKIDALEWVLAYYEDRTGSTPKELLETYLRRMYPLSDNSRQLLEWISILYYWENYKIIEGF